MDECRSEKVRKILHLEGRAAEYRPNYESGLAEITPARHKAEQDGQAALHALQPTQRPARWNARVICHARFPGPSAAVGNHCGWFLSMMQSRQLHIGHDPR